LALLRVGVISIVLPLSCDKDDWALLRVEVISIVLYFHVIKMTGRCCVLESFLLFSVPM
jgi:uncharacterized membrane protein HdeD (DUF308 family)